MAATVSCTLTNPLDVAKVRIQVQRAQVSFAVSSGVSLENAKKLGHFGYKNLIHGLSLLFQQEGFGALFKGGEASPSLTCYLSRLTYSFFNLSCRLECASLNEHPVVCNQHESRRDNPQLPHLKEAVSLMTCNVRTHVRTIKWINVSSCQKLWTKIVHVRWSWSKEMSSTCCCSHCFSMHFSTALLLRFPCSFNFYIELTFL